MCELTAARADKSRMSCELRALQEQVGGLDALAALHCWQPPASQRLASTRRPQPAQPPHLQSLPCALSCRRRWSLRSCCCSASARRASSWSRTSARYRTAWRRRRSSWSSRTTRCCARPGAALLPARLPASAPRITLCHVACSAAVRPTEPAPALPQDHGRGAGRRGALRGGAERGGPDAQGAGGLSAVLWGKFCTGAWGRHGARGRHRRG